MKGVWWIIAVVLIVLGGVLFTVAMSLNHWNFKALSTTAYVTNTHTVAEEFHSILVETDTADVSFFVCEGEDCTVSCYEEENAKHSVTVLDGVLQIRVENEKKWYEFVGISFESPSITVCLPKSIYSSVSVKSDTGGVKLPREMHADQIDISLCTGSVAVEASVKEALKVRTTTGEILVAGTQVGAAELSTTTGRIEMSSVTCTGDVRTHVTTGRVSMKDVRCSSLASAGATGDLSMSNVIAAGNFSIERGTGDVSMHACDAAELRIKTGTGSVTGSLLTGKSFFVSTGTGSREYPAGSTGGRCEITTGTGNVRITVTGA